MKSFTERKAEAHYRQSGGRMDRCDRCQESFRGVFNRREILSCRKVGVMDDADAYVGDDFVCDRFKRGTRR